MIDPATQLAFAISASPGVYALLLGSGLSRAANIPTGWDIVLDLVRKLAINYSEICDSDPVEWYVNRFGKEPNYSELLDSLTKLPGARQQLLRGYFEPNEEERQEGAKKPTKAHHAIADLVSRGFIKVIITTNFDRLLEQAIQDKGLSPAVLSTPDSLKGALPLRHQPCTILKLHGDYLDSRLRNTSPELEVYDDAFNRQLDTIFDEYGLVVCGWSAKWDTALRSAIERCPTRRFTWYWTTRGVPTDEARRLIELRKAEVITIEDADGFFPKLSDAVQSIVDSHRVNPDSVEAVVALEKRYLSEPRYRIHLDDLLHDETEATYAKLESFNANLKPSPDIQHCCVHYESMLEKLCALLVHGVAFGEDEDSSPWLRVLGRFAQKPPAKSGLNCPIYWHYPAVILFYAVGLAAIARDRHKTLVGLLTGLNVRSDRGEIPFLNDVWWREIDDWLRHLTEFERMYWPVSEKLHQMFRKPLERFVPDQTGYDALFVRFEYLRSLAYADYCNRNQGGNGWRILSGRFVLGFSWGDTDSISQRLHQEASIQKENWPLIRAGLFGGSFERFCEVRAGTDPHFRSEADRR